MGEVPLYPKCPTAGGVRRQGGGGSCDLVLTCQLSGQDRSLVVLICPLSQDGAIAMSLVSWHQPRNQSNGLIVGSASPGSGRSCLPEFPAVGIGRPPPVLDHIPLYIQLYGGVSGPRQGTCLWFHPAPRHYHSPQQTNGVRVEGEGRRRMTPRRGLRSLGLRMLWGPVPRRARM